MVLKFWLRHNEEQSRQESDENKGTVEPQYIEHRWLVYHG